MKFIEHLMRLPGMNLELADHVVNLTHRLLRRRLEDGELSSDVDAECFATEDDLEL